MRNTILPLILLSACATDDPTECDSGLVYDSALMQCEPPCTNSISTGSERPSQGATSAYYRTTVEAELEDAETDATIALLDSDGGEVAGTMAVDGDRLIYSPAEPLTPGATYTVSVAYSCGDPEWTFTVSDVGAEITETDLPGDTFELDLTSGRFVQPEGVGPLLQEYLTTQIYIDVLSAESGTIEMVGAVANDAGTGQSECTPTIPFPAADFDENPYFEVGPEETTLVIQGYSVTVDDLFISGAFAPDRSYITGAVLKGAIDTRPLVPILDDEGDDDAICGLAATIGVSCEECPDGGNFCLSIEVDSINAEAVDLTIQQQHEPTNTDPPDGSVSYCVNSGCASLPQCP